MASQPCRLTQALQFTRSTQLFRSLSCTRWRKSFCGTPVQSVNDKNARFRFSEIQFDTTLAGSHAPRLYEALQTCGLGPKSVEYKLSHRTGHDGSETADVDVDASVTLGQTIFSARVLGCTASSKRLNETGIQAAYRAGKHAAAHHLLNCNVFQTALCDYRTAWRAAKAAAAVEAWRKKSELPTMTDVVLSKLVDNGAFSVHSRSMSLDALSLAEGAHMIGVDVEGFDIDRPDWQRAWLVQLAFYTEKAGTTEGQGYCLVLLVSSDEEMRMFSGWLSERSLRGVKLILFDSPSDLRGIFKVDADKDLPSLQNIYDLKDRGSSLHELVGEHVVMTEVRKHTRLSESLAYLPYTKGLTEAQVRYAAADAIATLLVGQHLVGNV